MIDENFWNEMKQKYPVAMENFCVWIDKYKKDHWWEQLFNQGTINTGNTYYKAPKYHELPNAMQFGIFIEFARTCVAVAYTKYEFPDTIEEYIERCMRELQDRLDKQWQSIDSVPAVEVLFEVKDDEGNVYKAMPIIKYFKKPPLISPQPVFTGFWRTQKEVPGKGNIIAWRYIIEK